MAVLLSTIFPPFFLRFTINYYNKRVEAEIQQLADDEMKRHHELTPDDRESQLVGAIRNETAVFLCIQTQSMSKWGLLSSMMSTLTKMGLVKKAQVGPSLRLFSP